ncbi:hypothetical protein CCACVL1_01856, partial [Corchorus capsularis]
VKIVATVHVWRGSSYSKASLRLSAGNETTQMFDRQVLVEF